MKILYPAKITEQESGFFVEFIDLPDTFTEGGTLEEALINASEVLSGMLGFKLDEEQTIPAPSQKLKGAHYIAPDAKTQAKLLRKWDTAEHLKTEEDIAMFLEACIDEAGDDAAFIAKALGTIARAREVNF